MWWCLRCWWLSKSLSPPPLSLAIITFVAFASLRLVLVRPTLQTAFGVRREYHLLSSKVVDDGYEFWGSKKQARPSQTLNSGNLRTLRHASRPRRGEVLILGPPAHYDPCFFSSSYYVFLNQSQKTTLQCASPKFCSLHNYCDLLRNSGTIPLIL